MSFTEPLVTSTHLAAISDLFKSMVASFTSCFQRAREIVEKGDVQNCGVRRFNGVELVTCDAASFTEYCFESCHVLQDGH
jgi:hypothetical protein